MTTAQDGGKVVSLTHRPPLPPGYSWYSFLLEAESTPGPQCDRKNSMSMKNPMTLAGIEPATFRFVAQHLNHLNPRFRNIWGISWLDEELSASAKGLYCTEWIGWGYFTHCCNSQTAWISDLPLRGSSRSEGTCLSMHLICYDLNKANSVYYKHTRQLLH